MPEGGFSPDIQSSSPEQEVKYERIVLAEGGDILTLNGKDMLNAKNGIVLLMGSENPENAAKSKRLRLHYTDEEFDPNGEKKPHWLLIDADANYRSQPLKQGIPIPVGRENTLLFAPDEQARLRVSRKHVAIIPSGENVTIVQRSHTNKTFIDAPQTTIVSTDLNSQSEMTA